MLSKLRIALACLVLLAFTARVDAAWAFVSAAATGAGGQTAVTKSVTSGNAVIVVIFNQNGTDTPSISDGVNTYTQAANSPIEDTTNGGGISMFSAIAATSASITVTASGLTNTGFAGLSLLEYSGNAASSLGDGGKGTANLTGSTTTNAMTTGSFTPLVNGDLIVSAILDLGGSPTVAEYTAGTAPLTFTKRATGSQDPGGASAASFAVEDGVQTTAAAINPAWTQNTTHHAVGYSAAFKVNSGGGPTCPATRLTLGVGC